MSQKQGLVKCLLKRAQSQLNNEQPNKTLETSKIMEALKRNDYPIWFLKRRIKSLRRKTNSSFANNREIKTRIVLPYVSRYFKSLSKILRNVGILVCSKPHLTLKDISPKAKDSVERSSRPGVVYQIPCRDYTGVACRTSHFIELPCQTSFCLFLHFFLLVCFQWLSTLLPLMCVILVVYCKSCVCEFATSCVPSLTPSSRTFAVLPYNFADELM